MESRLLAAGRVCLDRGILEALNIDDLCAVAECTVGAFYSRFESKDAFFSALQFVICRERDTAVKRLLREAEAGDWSFDQVCAALISDLTSWYRINHGILRASLLHVENGENAWSPIRRLGLEHKILWLDLLEPKLPIALRPLERKHRIFFANQVINGTLVHILLNSPGPFGLKSRPIVERLTTMLKAYLTTPF
jgi:AcrR family transcriptional regulator